MAILAAPSRPNSFRNWISVRSQWNSGPLIRLIRVKFRSHPEEEEKEEEEEEERVVFEREGTKTKQNKRITVNNEKKNMINIWKKKQKKN